MKQDLCADRRERHVAWNGGSVHFAGLPEVKRSQQQACLRAISHLQFFEKRGDVRFYRSLLDRQAVGYLLVEKAFTNQGEHA